MIAPTIRLCTNRVKRKVFEDISRGISKSPSVTNVEAIVTKKDNRNDERQEKKLFKFKRYQRSLSTVTSQAISHAAVFADSEKTEDFMAVFPDLVKDLTADGRHRDMPEINKWLSELLEYNVPLGKKNRGVELTMAYKMLEKPENLTPENMKLAYILGWCCEMFHASFVISDDLIDGAQTRRGVPCWYRLENVGLSALNDAILVENSLYVILKKYFSNHPSYLPIMEMFHDMALKTAMGQCLDHHSHREGHPNLDIFTMERYNAIARYKCSYYTFKMPVGLAMYLAGIMEPELHRQAKHILLEIGHFLQVQDDFLDCYGDPEVTGKVPTDIREGKCTWLAVVALQRATPKQKKIFEEHYGRAEERSIEIIKDIYEQLSLPNTYAIYEEQSYNLIKTHIQQMSGGLPHKLFFKILKLVYGRDKTF